MADPGRRDKNTKKYAGMFLEFMRSEDYRTEIKDRESRVRYFSGALKKEKIKSMTELDFGEFISKLWAAQTWTNKEYLVQKLIADNEGLECIKKQLTDLLHGPDSFEIRYARFMESISGFGPGYVTEILCHFKPSEFGIWNHRAREALKALGYDEVLPLGKYRITAKEYSEFNKTEKQLAGLLDNLGIKISDLLMLDYFLWRVWQWSKSQSGAEKTKQTGQKGEFDHDEIRDFIKEIGVSLGFEAETEKLVQHGAKVDVVWRAKIANLGVVMYVFEVQKGGSIDSLVMNLQKAKKNPSVQKLIAVSDGKQLDKIRKEVKGLPADFVEALSFWDAGEVNDVHQKLSEVVGSIDRLQLVKSEFEVD